MKKGKGPQLERKQSKPPKLPPTPAFLGPEFTLGSEDGDDNAIGEIFKSVVKIYCTSVRPNFAMPWQKHRAEEFTSSGFVIQFGKGLAVICNAHGIANYSVVRIRLHGGSHKHVAKVLYVGHECDLALLTVEVAEFWKGLKPLQLATEAPMLQAPVICVGYPTGGDNLSITQGIVSRVAMGLYSHAGTELLSIQIDAAINPGNSGGPAMLDGQVVGVAFESLEDAENVGYIIPCAVMRHFLTDVTKNHKHTGFPVASFDWQPLENEALRKSFHLKDRDSGILVTKVAPRTEWGKTLKPDDIILDFDDVAIASDGTVPFRGSERVGFEYLVTGKFVGDIAKVCVQRDGKKECFEIKLAADDPLVPPHMLDRNPSYYIFGGLLFTTLSVPFLTAEFGESWHKAAPLRMASKLLYSEKTEPDEEVVVLVTTLPHETTIGYDSAGPAQVLKVNGTKIQNMKQFVGLMTKAEDKSFVRLDLDGDAITVLVVSKSEALGAQAEILEQNNIPSPVSPDLREAAGLAPLHSQTKGQASADKKESKKDSKQAAESHFQAQSHGQGKKSSANKTGASAETKAKETVSTSTENNNNSANANGTPQTKSGSQKGQQGGSSKKKGKGKNKQKDNSDATNAEKQDQEVDGNNDDDTNSAGAEQKTADPNSARNGNNNHQGRQRPAKPAASSTPNNPQSEKPTSPSHAKQSGIAALYKFKQRA